MAMFNSYVKLPEDISMAIFNSELLAYQRVRDWGEVWETHLGLTF